MAYTITQLNMLKVDLGLLSTPTEIDVYLGQKLDTAIARLTKQGIALDFNDPHHNDLVVVYAAWLYRHRADESQKTEMPKMVRTLRNDTLFGQKMGASE